MVEDKVTNNKYLDKQIDMYVLYLSQCFYYIPFKVKTNYDCAMTNEIFRLDSIAKNVG